MSNIGKNLRYISIGILCICTVYLVYAMVSNPLGSSANGMFGLAVAAGFIALGANKKGSKKKGDKAE